MVRELTRDAVQIKMKSKQQCPLISVHEYCYSAGLGLKVMGVSREEAQKIRNSENLEEMYETVDPLVKASERFAAYPNGEKLKQLILDCRVKETITEDSRALFDMGYGIENV
ncbi:MAG: DUF3837 family protein [Lachnospiraceae bacterium]|nr:DUF3837 family protein [Lachnospiraceae bacterium]